MRIVYVNQLMLKYKMFRMPNLKASDATISSK